MLLSVQVDLYIDERLANDVTNNAQLRSKTEINKSFILPANVTINILPSDGDYLLHLLYYIYYLQNK